MLPIVLVYNKTIHLYIHVAYSVGI